MFAGRASTNFQYTVNTSVYTGPLDLLLQLIERAELDITRLALAQVTDQYLEYTRSLPETSSEEVSAFLVMAARLLQIKSEALLPRPPQREAGEEDPGEALAKQLMIYKRFKELSLLLGGREAEGLHSYARQGPAARVDAPPDMEGITIENLLDIARWLLTQEPQLPELASVVPMPRVTIREKIAQIAAFLQQHSQGRFDQLLNDKTFRLDVVVTFLALLELVKRRMVQTSQPGLFGSIDFEAAEAWSEDTGFELEFGE